MTLGWGCTFCSRSNCEIDNVGASSRSPAVHIEAPHAMIKDTTVCARGGCGTGTGIHLEGGATSDGGHHAVINSCVIGNMGRDGITIQGASNTTISNSSIGVGAACIRAAHGPVRR